MIDLEIKVRGVEQVKANLLGLPPSLRAKLVAAVTASVIEIGADARARAPKRTGELQQSIHTEVREARTAVRGKVFSNDFTARFVEGGTNNDAVRVRAYVRRNVRGDLHSVQFTKRGTVRHKLSHVGVTAVKAYVRASHLKAEPFMRPAFDALRSRVEARIADAVSAATAEANA